MQSFDSADGGYNSAGLDTVGTPAAAAAAADTDAAVYGRSAGPAIVEPRESSTSISAAAASAVWAAPQQLPRRPASATWSGSGARGGAAVEEHAQFTSQLGAAMKRVKQREWEPGERGGSNNEGGQPHERARRDWNDGSGGGTGGGDASDTAPSRCSSSPRFSPAPTADARQTQTQTQQHQHRQSPAPTRSRGVVTDDAISRVYDLAEAARRGTARLSRGWKASALDHQRVRSDLRAVEEQLAAASRRDREAQCSVSGNLRALLADAGASRRECQRLQQVVGHLETLCAEREVEVEALRADLARTAAERAEAVARFEQYLGSARAEGSALGRRISALDAELAALSAENEQMRAEVLYAPRC